MAESEYATDVLFGDRRCSDNSTPLGFITACFALAPADHPFPRQTCLRFPLECLSLASEEGRVSDYYKTVPADTSATFAVLFTPGTGTTHVANIGLLRGCGMRHKDAYLSRVIHLAFGRTKRRSLQIAIPTLILVLVGAVSHMAMRTPVPMPFKLVSFTNRTEGSAALLRIEPPTHGMIANTVKFDGQKAELLWKNDSGQITTNSAASIEFNFHRPSRDPQILVPLPELAVEFRVNYNQVLRRGYRGKTARKVLFYFPWTETERYESDWLQVTNSKTEGWFLYNPRTTPLKTR